MFADFNREFASRKIYISAKKFGEVFVVNWKFPWILLFGEEKLIKTVGNFQVEVIFADAQICDVNGMRQMKTSKSSS